MAKSTFLIGAALAALIAFPAAGWSAEINPSSMLRDEKPAFSELVRSEGNGFERQVKRHRNGIGIGIGAGILGGLILGQALRDPYYQDRYDYYDDRYYRDIDVPNDDEAVSYCFSRFKSYDPNSGTYLGYDGYRHPCP